ncbi:extensin-like [Cimex lectularius]|uniref:Uncharacterized protein n=1 Tax=Cimex lectularius TaxID=79782 RepID=A0A8I6S4J3_CIMLE|nr:extensin-like [Cimex lectularius]
MYKSKVFLIWCLLAICNYCGAVLTQQTNDTEQAASGNVNRREAPSGFGVPPTGLSDSYGAPLPADSYGPPHPHVGPKPVYGPPPLPKLPQDEYGPPPAPSDSYGPPPSLNFGVPKPVYGPPKPVYGPPKPEYGPPPKPEYGPPDLSPPPHKPPKHFGGGGGGSYHGPSFHGPKPHYGPPKPVYGPPNKFGPSSPSHSYGPPKSVYGPPPSKPKPVYGPPKHSFTPPKQFYGPPKPKPVYGPPKHHSSGPPKSTYGPPKHNLSPPKPVYGPPKITYGPPSGSYGVPHAPPGVPSPPTPPEITYDGWQPIPGLSPHPDGNCPPDSGHHHHHSDGGGYDGPPPPLTGGHVSQDYGPPQNAGGHPSDTYGPPTNNGLGVDLSAPSVNQSPFSFEGGHGSHGGHDLNQNFEPPPPLSGTYGPPSGSYGPPSSGPQDSYGPPPSPSGSYGPPSGHDQSSLLPPAGSYGPPPSNNYGPPPPPGGSYGPPPPGGSYGPPPSDSYGPPSNSFASPPSQSYGVPQNHADTGNFGFPIASCCGTPPPEVGHQHKPPPLGLAYGVPSGKQIEGPNLQPKVPVKFREPVPKGLIEAIGESVEFKTSGHGRPFQGGTYIPPSVPEVPQHVPDDDNNHYAASLSHHDLSVGQPFRLQNSFDQSPSVDLTPPGGYQSHGAHSEEAPSYAVPAEPSRSNDFNHGEIANSLGLENADITQSQSIDFGNALDFKLQGNQGTYDLQVQGGSSGSNPEQILPRGLLQNILSAIEQQPSTVQAVQHSYGPDSLPSGSELVRIKHESSDSETLSVEESVNAASATNDIRPSNIALYFNPDHNKPQNETFSSFPESRDQLVEDKKDGSYVVFDSPSSKYSYDITSQTESR